MAFLLVFAVDHQSPPPQVESQYWLITLSWFSAADR